MRLGSVEFDMPAVVERKKRIVGTLTKGVEGMLKRAGVETIAGTARLVSRNAVAGGRGALRGGQHPAGDRVAAGQCRRFPGLGSEGVLDSNTVFDLDARAGENRDHRRRLHRAGVRVFLQRGRRARSASMKCCRRSRPDATRRSAAGCSQIMKRTGIEFNLSSKVLGIEGDTIRYAAPTGRRPALRPIAS